MHNVNQTNDLQGDDHCLLIGPNRLKNNNTQNKTKTKQKTEFAQINQSVQVELARDLAIWLAFICLL